MTITSEQVTMLIAAAVAIGTYFSQKNAREAAVSAQDAVNLAKDLQLKTEDLKERTEVIRIEINSRMTQLVKTEVEKALAEGRLVGIEQQKAEQAVLDKGK